jgi:putative chitinase
MDNIAKIKQNIINLFSTKLAKNSEQNPDQASQPQTVLNVDILSNIVKELSIIRQIKEGSITYDKKKNQYLNKKGTRTTPENILKPTFAEFKPTVSEQATKIKDAVVDKAPAGVGILGLLMLLSSPQVRDFLWGALKEIIVGKDSLLPEPIREFFKLFANKDEKNPANVLIKANEENEQLSKDIDDGSNELENGESEIEQLVKNVLPKVQNAEKSVDKAKETISETEEVVGETKPTLAATPTPGPTPTPAQTPAPVPAPVPTAKTVPSGFEGGGQAKEGYVGAATANMRTGRRVEKIELTPTPAPTPIAKPTPAPTTQPSSVSQPQVATEPTRSSTLQKVTGIQDIIIQSLTQFGITSSKAHANILATIKAESNFEPRNENLNYSSGERIQAVFGKRRFASIEFAKMFVNNPEGLANEAYKTTDGNSELGDGWKYRGRGFIQHTGKNQYVALSKFIGVDLVNNPDALNEPSIAAKAIAWFFLSYKRLKPTDLENMGTVNKAVGFSDPTGKKSTERIQSSENIFSSLNPPDSSTQLAMENPKPSTGTQVAAASAIVVGAKKEEEAKKKVVTNVAVVTTTQTTFIPKKGSVLAAQPMTS